MPHIIIEYPEPAVSEKQLPEILQAVHAAIAASGLFEASHIKTRLYPFRFYTNAGGDKPYIHIQARIKSGRSTEQKKQLSAAILAALTGLELAVAVSTVEVIDMERDSYSKYSM